MNEQIKTRTLLKRIFSFENIAILLMLSQLFIKFAVEFPSIAELIDPEMPLEQTAWIMTAGWLILVPICIQKNRSAFLAGGLWGVMHACMGIVPPIVGACDHWVAGTAVSIQGLLIALFSFLAFRKLNGKPAVYERGVEN